MILNDKQIHELVCTQNMIQPFWDQQVSNGVISWGLSSYGYDAKLDPSELKMFTNVRNTYVDPKDFDNDNFVTVNPYTDAPNSNAMYFDMPPHSYALGRTVERFVIPRNVMAICMGKSTYVRSGIIVNVTPLEPEWEGFVTLEISNVSSLPVRVYANEGICQFIFLEGEGCRTSYKDRKGKYQNQKGIVAPKVMKK